MTEYLKRPEGLCDRGNAAYDAIMAFLTKHELTDTGGCVAFYSPQEWKDRGEEYGTESFLVVVYDGGEHAYAFSYDWGVPEMIDGMSKALDEIGLYSQPCTGWYSAIYD
jgi:hypothetical protein